MYILSILNLTSYFKSLFVYKLFQNGEPKKEEFQRYLEKSGVIDALTKVLVGLYEIPEKPMNPIDFIKEYLGTAATQDLEKLKLQIEQQQKSIAEKDTEIA